MSGDTTTAEVKTDDKTVVVPSTNGHNATVPAVIIEKPATEKTWRQDRVLFWVGIIIILIITFPTFGYMGMVEASRYFPDDTLPKGWFLELLIEALNYGIGGITILFLVAMDTVPGNNWKKEIKADGLGFIAISALSYALVYLVMLYKLNTLETLTPESAVYFSLSQTMMWAGIKGAIGAMIFIWSAKSFWSHFTSKDE